MINIVCGIHLLLGAIVDMKTRMISRRFLLFYAATSLVCHIIWKDLAIEKILFGCIPGILFLIFAAVSQESIGYGDGWMILITGIALGFEKCFWILLSALVWVFVAGIVYCIFRHSMRKATLPFLPFLFFGWILQTIG